MAWQVGKPADGGILRLGPSKIRANFEALESAWNGDHVDLTGDGAGSTKHNKVTLPDQTASLPPAPGSGNVVLYSALSGAVTELMLRRDSNVPMKLFGLQSLAGTGYMWLGGLLIKWGSHDCSTSSTTITFPTAGSEPAYTTIYNAWITRRINNTGSVYWHMRAFDTTTITFYISASSSSGYVDYLAIGV